MATRGTGSKTTRQSTRPKTPTRKPARKPRRKPSASEWRGLSLSPEHQRELFALGLITIALVTLVFFLTGTTGGVGSFYVEGMQGTFGGGALLVPLALGLLGLLILFQVRTQDAQLTGAHVLGTLLVVGMLLALLEFPVHHIPLTERPDEGGGWLGYGMVALLIALIGRPAALVVVLVMMLAGLLLTFNITLREVIGGMAAGLQSLLRLMLLDPPEEGFPAARAAPPRDALAFEAPPQATSPPPGPPGPEDVVATPIAARLTRASLFRRNEEKQPTKEPAKGTPGKAPTPAAMPTDAAQQASPSQPQPESGPAPAKERASARKRAEKTPAPEPEIVQETLDGFESPPVYRAWPMPSLHLLDASSAISISDDDLKVQARLARLIEETLASFKVEAQVVGVNPGPAITQFELQPAMGVKVSKITALEKDLALALAAPSIRIEAPIPGKSVVGIEIPNSAIATVTLREVIDGDEFSQSKGKLKLPLGKDISGTPAIADLTRMPHLLIAGSTGSGKSVALNAFLCGLLLQHTPDDLKLILVDPKMVELIVYNHIPHLLAPVVTELERVVPMLKWATREMERRYKVFARHGCRNLESYKQLAQRRADLEPMPYTLIIIDELADLMMMAPDEIETYLCRLAQMARATGIHLIIATQRPSVDVITGLIKANFPSRVAFAVTSQVDSRVILDTQGAEQLLGRGDMLYMAADASRLVRIQGTYVADREVERIVSFWRSAQPPVPGTPAPADQAAPQPPGSPASGADLSARQPQRPADGHPDAAGQPGAGQPGAAQTGAGQTGAAHTGGGSLAFEAPASFLDAREQDELLPQALELVQQHTRASASLLQRRLRIGYSKAAQLIDLLEQQGVVGPAEGGRSREVLHQPPGEPRQAD